MDLLSLVAEFSGDMTIIANVSDVALEVTMELARKAEELKFDAISIMPPGFFPTTQEDLLAYFLHVSEKSSLPVILYNYPEVTGTRISLSTISAFSALAPMIGLKQSGQEFSYLRDLVPMGNELGFEVFAGTDTRVPEALALGASGSIGGLVNVVPEYLVGIYANHQRDPSCASDVPSGRLRKIGETIDQLAFPLNVAAGVQSRRLVVGKSKSVISAETRTLFSRVCGELQDLFETWGLEPALEDEHQPQTESYL
jgi:4-hydroxy-tetrahydrodipicolinate synthase